MRRNFSLDDASCADNAAFANMRTSQYNDTCADPAILFNNNRGGVKTCFQSFKTKSMIMIIDCYIRSNRTAISYRYTVVTYDNTVSGQ